jgi:hypothetical protein
VLLVFAGSCGFGDSFVIRSSLGGGFEPAPQGVAASTTF